jgi:hypothetical protein
VASQGQRRRWGSWGISERRAIGAALSHFQCWRQIIDLNLPGAFIFEDDCSFQNSVTADDVYHYVYHRLNEGFQYVSLGSFSPLRMLLPSKAHMGSSLSIDF